MKKGRPPIPAAIRRVVRQRCGFGCVICGRSIYEMDHIEEWSKTHSHDVGNLTLLCREHHDHKTKGRMSNAVLLEANRNPYNINKGKTYPTVYSINDASNFRITYGTLKSVWRGVRNHRYPVLILDGLPALSFTVRQGIVLLNLRAQAPDGRNMLVVEEGEVVIATSAWDCELVGSALKIWTDAREVSVEVKFGGEEIEVVRSHFFGIFGTLAAVDEQGFVAQLDRIGRGVIKRGWFERGCVVVGPGLASTAVHNGGGILSETLVLAHERLASYDGIKRIFKQSDSFDILRALVEQSAASGVVQKGAMRDRAARSFRAAIIFQQVLMENFDFIDSTDIAIEHYNLANAYRQLAEVTDWPVHTLQESRDHFRAALAQPDYVGLNRASALICLVLVLLQLDRHGELTDKSSCLEMLKEARAVYERAAPTGALNNPVASFNQLVDLEKQARSLP